MAEKRTFFGVPLITEKEVPESNPFGTPSAMAQDEAATTATDVDMVVGNLEQNINYLKQMGGQVDGSTEQLLNAAKQLRTGPNTNASLQEVAAMMPQLQQAERKVADEAAAKTQQVAGAALGAVAGVAGLVGGATDLSNAFGGLLSPPPTDMARDAAQAAPALS